MNEQNLLIQQHVLRCKRVQEVYDLYIANFGGCSLQTVTVMEKKLDELSGNYAGSS